MKAILLTVEGEALPIEIAGYAALSAAVGGYIEALGAADGSFVAYINEEGKLNGLPINPAATKLARAELGLTFDVIVGPMVLVGPTDGDGEDTDVPFDRVVTALAALG